ncbi:protein of unknown function [Rhodovastum atsumiense]|nr:protein of unknown function [Rhodovastum atsumiense]
MDSNQRRRAPTDLQSVPFSHSGTPPVEAGTNPFLALLSTRHPRGPPLLSPAARKGYTGLA